MDYELFLDKVKAFCESENHYLPLLSNISALIYNELPDISWAGFYLTKDEGLILGPFQGKPACIRIPYGKGVCGTALKENRTELVPDVHKFPGHIACDCDTNSELVIPIRKGNNVIGVLDLDSRKFSRFSAEDALQLEKAVNIIENNIDFTTLII